MPALDRQYVSSQLDGAQTVGGTIKMQLLNREFASTDNVQFLYLNVYVVSGDGLTVRGTVLSMADYSNGLELLDTAFRNKTWVVSGAGTVAAQNGDRIVVELGYEAATVNTTPEASGKFGEAAADLPEDETTTSDGAGWIEFSGALAFISTAGTEVVAGGTLTPTGNLIKQPQIRRGGTLTTSGSDTNRKTLHRSYAGTLTSSGLAIVLKVFLATGLGGTLTIAGNLLNAFGRGVSAAGSLTFIGTLLRGPGIVVGGALTSAGRIVHQAGKALDGALTTSGAATPLKLFNRGGAGTLTPTGDLSKTPGKALSGDLTTSGSMSRGFIKLFSGILNFFGTLTVGQATGTVGVCPLTASDLIARIYERLDGNTTYYTQLEVLHALDVIQRLFAWLTLCVEHRASFSLFAGQTFYTPRTELFDFWAPLKLSFQDTLTGARLLPITLDDLDKLDEGWQNVSGTPRYYCSMGFNFIAIYPQLDTPASIALHFTYAAEPTPLSSPGSPLSVSTDVAPLLVDGAIWWLRMKEGGQEFQNTMQNLARFVEGAQKHRAYVQARSKSQLYDKHPFELSNFDISRFLFRPPREKKGKQ